MSKIFVVIPAYNEESSIGKVIRQVKKEGYAKIIVVDDGSSDRTATVARDNGAIVLEHIINRGQGAGLKTGIDFALKENADIVVTFDADGQFLAQEISIIVKPVLERQAEVSLGSRFLGKAKNIPFFKKIVLKLGIVVVHVLYGIRVTDSQNGFRALSRKAAETIEISSNRMEHAGEILHEIKEKRLSFVEVPITVIYSDYAIRKGQSWTKSLSLGLKMLMKKFMR